jgi:hypothetical protein
MLTGSQAEQDEIVRTFARVRSALHGVRVKTQRTAAEHERLAGWYVEQGDEVAARMEGRVAAAQRQRLADLDAALDALDAAVSTALDQDP